jgi:hypothetical protein
MNCWAEPEPSLDSRMRKGFLAPEEPAPDPTPFPDGLPGVLCHFAPGHAARLSPVMRESSGSILDKACPQIVTDAQAIVRPGNGEPRVISLNPPGVGRTLWEQAVRHSTENCWMLCLDAAVRDGSTAGETKWLYPGRAFLWIPDAARWEVLFRRREGEALECVSLANRVVRVWSDEGAEVSTTVGWVLQASLRRKDGVARVSLPPPPSAPACELLEDAWSRESDGERRFASVRLRFDVRRHRRGATYRLSLEGGSSVEGEWEGATVGACVEEGAESVEQRMRLFRLDSLPERSSSETGDSPFPVAGSLVRRGASLTVELSAVPLGWKGQASLTVSVPRLSAVANSLVAPAPASVAAVSSDEWLSEVTCWKGKLQSLADVPSRVTSVAVARATPSSVSLRWDAPSGNGERVSQYSVEVRDEGEWTEAETTSTPTTTLRGMRPGQRVEVRVRAGNSVGFGAFSDPLAVSTTVAVPPAPTLRATKAKPRLVDRASLELALDGTADGGSPVTGVRVFVVSLRPVRADVAAALVQRFCEISEGALGVCDAVSRAGVCVCSEEEVTEVWRSLGATVGDAGVALCEQALSGSREERETLRPSCRRFEVSDFPPERLCGVFVEAENAAGMSSPSDVVFFVTGPVAPSPVRDVVSHGVRRIEGDRCELGVSVEWDWGGTMSVLSTRAHLHAEVEWRSSSISGTVVCERWRRATVLSDARLRPGMLVESRVRSSNGFFASDWSEWRSSTVPDGLPVKPRVGLVSLGAEGWSDAFDVDAEMRDVGRCLGVTLSREGVVPLGGMMEVQLRERCGESDTRVAPSLSWGWRGGSQMDRHSRFLRSGVKVFAEEADVPGLVERLRRTRAMSDRDIAHPDPRWSEHPLASLVSYRVASRSVARRLAQGALLASVAPASDVKRMLGLAESSWRSVPTSVRTVTVDRHSGPFRAGSAVDAVSERDGMFYSGRVTSVTSDAVEVLFEGFGVSQRVSLRDAGALRHRLSPGETCVALHPDDQHWRSARVLGLSPQGYRVSFDDGGMMVDLPSAAVGGETAAALERLDVAASRVGEPSDRERRPASWKRVVSDGPAVSESVGPTPSVPSPSGQWWGEQLFRRKGWTTIRKWEEAGGFVRMRVFGLCPGVCYEARCRWRNDVGASDWSDVATVCLSPGEPSSPVVARVRPGDVDHHSSRQRCWVDVVPPLWSGGPERPSEVRVEVLDASFGAVGGWTEAARVSPPTAPLPNDSLYEWSDVLWRVEVFVPCGRRWLVRATASHTSGGVRWESEPSAPRQFVSDASSPGPLRLRVSRLAGLSDALQAAGRWIAGGCSGALDVSDTEGATTVACWWDAPASLNGASVTGYQCALRVLVGADDERRPDEGDGAQLSERVPLGFGLVSDAVSLEPGMWTVLPPTAAPVVLVTLPAEGVLVQACARSLSTAGASRWSAATELRAPRAVPVPEAPRVLMSDAKSLLVEVDSAVASDDEDEEDAQVLVLVERPGDRIALDAAVSAWRSVSDAPSAPQSLQVQRMRLEGGAETDDVAAVSVAPGATVRLSGLQEASLYRVRARLWEGDRHSAWSEWSDAVSTSCHERVAPTAPRPAFEGWWSLVSGGASMGYRGMKVVPRARVAGSLRDAVGEVSDDASLTDAVRRVAPAAVTWPRSRGRPDPVKRYRVVVHGAEPVEWAPTWAPRAVSRALPAVRFVGGNGRAEVLTEGRGVMVLVEGKGDLRVEVEAEDVGGLVSDAGSLSLEASEVAASLARELDAECRFVRAVSERHPVSDASAQHFVGPGRDAFERAMQRRSTKPKQPVPTSPQTVVVSVLVAILALVVAAIYPQLRDLVTDILRDL